MEFYNLASDFSLLLAILLSTSKSARVFDYKGIISYSFIFAAFLISYGKPWLWSGYNVWLALILVIFLNNSFQGREFMERIKSYLGLWRYMLSIFLCLVAIHMMYGIAHLLIPALVILIMLFLIATKRAN
ncbi:hypothetical protein [Companilactobacillus kimchiensis]|uniref:Uncharacterized protein n=1 Tax=Companilactobacillus kimchiensis TaxID=993692 RepID=A0A0R2LB29_9LACO|nr:hypothetical protein [Companilactobacillus kimchiensis]KRN99118.1 hypothetical protein IV57_GL000543 [Companilactobacillus kimchiensis]